MSTIVRPRRRCPWVSSQRGRSLACSCRESQHAAEPTSVASTLSESSPGRSLCGLEQPRRESERKAALVMSGLVGMRENGRLNMTHLHRQADGCKREKNGAACIVSSGVRSTTAAAHGARRTPGVPPPLFEAARVDWVVAAGACPHRVVRMHRLEADDTVGLTATRAPHCGVR